MATSADVLRVLLIEDDEDDYLITRDMLDSQDRSRIKLDWCADYDSGLATLREQRHDIYLIDYRLGRRTGLDLVRDGFSASALAPVIILTGQSDFDVDLEATALGVTDFLVKHELDALSLERSIRYAVSHQRAIGELARSEERYALAVRAANDGIWDWDLGSNRIYFSPRWHAILGLAESETSAPSTWFDLVHEDDLAALHAAIDAHLSGQASYLQSEHRMQHADGTWRWVLTRGLVTRNRAGEPTRMAGSLSDINDRHIAQGRLEHAAHHDVLTGLPNRALFMHQLERVLARSSRDVGGGCAVLFLDIDRFKLVNDSLSHALGDRLLVAFAARLTSALRPGDTVARMGGDEFTMLLDGVVGVDAAIGVAARIEQALADPFDIDGHELFLPASIGIALSTPAMSPSDLLRNADLAMYDAKRRGGPVYSVFDTSMHRRTADRLTRENALRHAVENAMIRVHYQPIIDLATGRIRAFEALARWPEGWPVVPPLDFIAIAEETGMIGPLGQHVLRTALGTLARWRSTGMVADDVTISVNVSGRQLDDANLPATILASLAEAGLPATALALEITESVLMREPERMQMFVSEVCTSGVSLHLDDFGTGYSSLTALHRFPVTTLKIDRSFVATMTECHGGSEVIVRSTIALAHSLGLQVIAEGIEGAAQAQRLRALGCEYGQGYRFAKPLSRDDAEAVLAEWSPEKAAELAEGSAAAILPR